MASNHLLGAAIVSPTSAMTRIIFPFRVRERECVRERYIYREGEEQGQKEKARDRYMFLEIARECVKQGAWVLCGERGGRGRERRREGEGERERERDRERETEKEKSWQQQSKRGLRPCRYTPERESERARECV